MHRADDQRRGGIDVHAGADPAEALLTAQVGGQQVRQPAAVAAMVTTLRRDVT